ncbi:hypothetical protein HRR83_000062 [Exophiala dermatitidis]|uniref:S-adenosyl-L-methionine-dependent methyltransferase n=2 Tax=Exophiala dermatitidis TaxID=5970 RepID=H6C873_EXODN|nr:uncharacterized protein HMPREF1120_08267 [Exophiala dermatitidis NIH/UT8656]KAJ4523415.1 hypothetical protein HRR73_002596 [Exophiala dermatitidis]EHY60300.1 hypothetical protein HMPREF1120_08267 [Exophiala dermatitidis NIH/UT8656]KAJ4524466.1 hypothetical protein HRR75_000054 [Exophiala dermatitidis]KAJ4527311.1 hypothetical protein HRR74_000063 [Exophiala dermatitidis]KAJ4530866.1 hypothetical protein HRR76_008558 [Exophiala dermatitidis]
MSQWPPLKARLLSLLDPGFLLCQSCYSFLTTAFEYFLLQRHLPTPSSFHVVRDEAFSRFWTKVTTPSDPPAPPVGSATLVPPILSRAHGVVLDIGPGSGSHVSLFAENANVTAIYGAEPCVGLHAPLQARINEAKLTDKYHILNCSADKKAIVDALAKEGVSVTDEGVFDTIACVRVLCSVPNLDQTAKELYSLLRPGGDLIVVEHIKNPWTKTGSLLGRFMQIFYHAIGWPFFLAGCMMDRDTAAILKRAGDWEAVDLKTHFEWSALPYLSGTLTKRK